MGVAAFAGLFFKFPKHFKKVATIAKNVATIASGLLHFKSTCNLRKTLLILLHNRATLVVASVPERAGRSMNAIDDHKRISELIDHEFLT